MRPHLDYCSLVWSPFLKKDILSIENVQRRVTEIIPSIYALTYEERLKCTGLISLHGEPPTQGGSARSCQYPEMLRESRPSYQLQHERQNIQRTHAETREAKGKILELRRHSFSTRVIDAWTTRPHGRSTVNQHVEGGLTTATSWGVHKLETKQLPSWPSDNLKHSITGKSQVNHNPNHTIFLTLT